MAESFLVGAGEVGQVAEAGIRHHILHPFRSVAEQFPGQVEALADQPFLGSDRLRPV